MTELERRQEQLWKAERNWRASQQRERAAKVKRDRVIRSVHRAGFGYGSIARWLGEIGYEVHRSLIERICRQED